MSSKNNIDLKTVAGFGDEWNRFDQTGMSDSEAEELFKGYFAVFPWASLPSGAAGFDLGCGSGRWARWVAPKVGTLHCIDPSDAIEVARKNLETYRNCVLHRASVDTIPIPDQSMDFGYSLGVLHHIPDTKGALVACAQKLKPGAPLLLYLYYAFDNKPAWFRMIWRLSNLLRVLVCRLPHGLRYMVSQLIAGLVYWPLARTGKLVEKLGGNVSHWPLAVYRDRSFYVMRTDALDRFGTRLEQRFSRAQIREMMESAGLENIQFSDAVPYWCAVGFASKGRSSRATS